MITPVVARWQRRLAAQMRLAAGVDSAADGQRLVVGGG